MVISERADFDERYYPDLKGAHSSSPPLSLSLTPSFLSTSRQPSSGFINHSAVSEDDQVTSAAHPGGEELIAGQSEPAGRIPDPPTVPAVPVVPAAAAAPPIHPQDDQNFILPPAVQPPSPAHSRRHNTLILLPLILHLLENASGGLYIMVCLLHLLLLLPLSLDILFQLHSTLHLLLYLLAYPLLLQLSHRYSLPDTRPEAT